MGEPGRICPLSYRHGAAALMTASTLGTDVAWIAGGLYGNPEALTALEQRLAAEPDGPRVRLIFNGDFHWFDADPEDFATIQRRVTRHTALAGNVEAELAAPDADAGCGCAYPEFVDDATVARSNRIMERLRNTAAEVEGAMATLAALPRLLRLRIEGCTFGVIHGDPDALAGWGFAIEHVAGPRATTDAGRVRDWAKRAGVDGFACSHTCLPWAAAFGGIPVINNGSAGMPNFAGRPDEVLVSRIAPAALAAPDARYAVEAHGLRCEAIPIAIDGTAWRTRFAATWPPGSPAHESYCRRLSEGPAHDIDDTVAGASTSRGKGPPSRGDDAGNRAAGG